MDLLESLIPIHERGARSVFVANEDQVFPFASEINSKTTLFIRDSEQLQSFLDEKNGHANGTSTHVNGGILSRLLTGTKIKFSAFEVDLAKAFFTPNLSRALRQCDNYIVYEDSIEGVQFAELFDIFVSTPAHTRPCILLVSNKDESKLASKLSYVSDTIEFIDTSKKVDKKIHVKRRAPKDLEDYLDLYARGVYHTAVRSKIGSLLKKTQTSDPIRRLASQVIQLQAMLMTEERHRVEPAIDRVLERLEHDLEGIDIDQKNDWLRLKCYLLLQKTYCSELKGPLDQALAIATTLGGEFDRALCMRFAHILGLESPLEQHMLRTAEDTFRRYDSQELAFYCANNLRVSSFSSDVEIPERFAELCAEIEQRLPSLFRKHDIIYNHGIENLLGGNLREAEDIFRGIIGSSARALIQTSAKLALLIKKRVAENAASPEDILDVLDGVERTIPDVNKWHRSNITLNTLILARHYKQNWKILYERYGYLIEIKGDSDVHDSLRENERLAHYLGVRESDAGGAIAGPFGRLYGKTNCLIPYYFIWS